MQKIYMFGRELSVKNDLKEILLKDADRLIQFFLNDKNLDIEDLIECAGIISDLSEEEKDIITKDELIAILDFLSEFKVNDNDNYFINSFEVGNEKYITTANDGKFVYTAMEIGALQKALSDGNDLTNFYSKIAAAVFRKQNEQGKPTSLGNEPAEEFQKRIEFFKENMTLNYINSYMQEYQKNILKIYDKSNSNS